MLFRTLCILKERRTVINGFLKTTSGRSIRSYRQLSPQIRVLVGGIENSKVEKCKFHTTQRRDIPPGFALLIRPLTRVGAFLFGKYVKRWWARKSPEEKEMYKKWFSARRQKIYGALGAVLAGLLLFCLTHMERDPLTGRYRFIILTKEQQKVLGKVTFDVHLEMHQDSIVRSDHPAYVRLVRITDRLIKANQDLPQVTDRHWTLSVVDSDAKNAYVLPGGNIFVFLGALKITENDDQLAIILAHEMAHVLLQHPIEQVSRNALLDILLAAPIAIIWATFPDLLAFLIQALGVNLMNVLVTLPYSRNAETEADDLGVKLAAKSCFDVREAIVFWKIMQMLTDFKIEPKDIPWLSTHPNHEEREKHLSAKMDEALMIRTESGCPKLSRYDPIESFNSRSAKQHAAFLKARGILYYNFVFILVCLIFMRVVIVGTIFHIICGILTSSEFNLSQFHCIPRRFLIHDESHLCSVVNINMILIIILFIFRGSAILAYNIHEKPSLMLQDSTISHFGYSIILHAQQNPRKSWLIVGAPKSKLASVEEPGLVYRYDLQLEKSLPVRVQPKELGEERGFIRSLKHEIIIRKNYSWFGASMAIDPNANILTVCAPRTMITFYSLVMNVGSMHGICYSGKITADELEFEDKDLDAHDFSTDFWYHPLHGFSVHYPSPTSNRTNNMISGTPKEELIGSIFIKGQSRPVYLPTDDDRAMFGYAVSSGYFSGREKLLYAGGAPGWHLIGRVGIIDPVTDPPTVIAQIDGTMIGEYFGASLAACDLNNDGFDEIIVGAPHWGVDYGRVYIYLGNSRLRFEKADVILNGYKEQGRFGYSLACGDLDRDGFDDLIVSAPWEGNGVVYIYNGDSTLQSKFEMNSQNITVTSPVTTFGFSLAKPVDIDFNGFPDLAIGAYKSNYAMVLNSRPVVKSNFRAVTIPFSLDRNSTSFVIQVCANHTKLGSPSHESFDLIVHIDGSFKRVNKSRIYLSYLSWSGDTEETVCLNETVPLAETITNYIDPIPIMVKHIYGLWRISDEAGIVECTLCPIEYDGSSESQEIKIPFNIGCGDDEICTSLLSISSSFYYTSNGTALENNTWIIGSKDIILQINISNAEEPAYSTALTLTLPRNVYLRSVLDTCKENEESGISEIICELEKPLLTGHHNTLIFDLNMGKINNGSHDNTNLTFTATVTTRSRQQGDSSVEFRLHLQANASVTLEGRANERSYDILSAEDSTQNISFEHLYQISKFGLTPVSTTRLTVKVPYRVGNMDFLALTNKPMVMMIGRLSECSIQDIPVALNANSNHSRLKRTTNPTSQLLQFSGSGIFSHNFGRFSASTTSGPNLTSVNCSSTAVQCGSIICDVGVLNTDRDSASLRLQFSINFPRLMENYEFDDNGRIIDVITEAWVDFPEPVNWTVPGTGNVTKVTTTFIKIAPPSRLTVWIIAGCILLGLLALFLIAIGLRLMGFFKREQKERMEEMKDSDGHKDTRRLSNSNF
ncbi:integrin alpha-4-like [Diachasmimorpha longicaudata]|uniref:integrin alpha-4-like n=1 Tax=Diachasmimorpha longicaudata TaxID=58733 RepID=UPI0030B91325